jgi:superfamily II DNA helicase RecQ
LGNQRATFKSDQQISAVLNAIFSTRDLLIVLPTGQGKSLAFYLCALYHRTKCTLVITPLESLRRDLFVCGSAAIEIATWTPNLQFHDPHPPQLVLVSVEQAKEEAFRTWLEVNEPNISKIFIDEIHLVETQTKFRWYLRDVQKIRTVKLPLVFLSATFPSVMEKHLKSNFSCKALDVIRDRTARRNLRYEIRHHKNAQTMMDAFLVALREKVQHLQQLFEANVGCLFLTMFNPYLFNSLWRLALILVQHSRVKEV